MSQVFEKLEKIILDRKKNPKKDSYTCELFEKGLGKIVEKVLEESEEVTRAAESEGKQRTTSEAADLIYHLLVLLANQQISLSEVEKELQRRMK